MKSPTEKIYDLIAKFDTAMLITNGRDQTLHARPMGIVKVEDNCDVWFFSGRTSEKNQEIEQDHQVLLAFQKDHGCYVSLSGHAQLVADRAQMAALWKESYKTWFPGGVDDPNLMLIRVRSSGAEYWDSTGFKGVKYLFETAKAYVTGTVPEIQQDQHDRVALK